MYYTPLLWLKTHINKAKGAINTILWLGPVNLCSFQGWMLRRKNAHLHKREFWNDTQITITIYMYIYICMYIQIYMYTFIYMYFQNTIYSIQPLEYIHTHAHTHTHIYICNHTQIYTHTQHTKPLCGLCWRCSDEARKFDIH